MKKIILCAYPRAGLANKLLVLAKCHVKAYESDAIVVETSFAQLPLFSAIRNFRQPRIYLCCPIQTELLRPCFWTLLYELRLSRIVFRPFRHFLQLETIDYFDSYPLYANPYVDLTSDNTGEVAKTVLRKRLGLSSSIIENSRNHGICTAAIHIRLGDFKTSADGHIRPNTRMPLNYYTDLIKTLVSFYVKTALPWRINVYTDEPAVVRRLIPDLKGIEVCSGNPFEDFVALVESDVLAPTPWSTFSGLAAHLSMNKVIVLPEQLHFQFRDNKDLVISSPSGLNSALNEYYSKSLR
mgnify:CR=1 FL=1